MSIEKCLLAASLMAVMLNIAGARTAQADPLTPLTPSQVQYLDHARSVFSLSHDPTGFRSDGELLVLGQYACEVRADSLVGFGATAVPPTLIQLAFIYLCPQ